jgi:hypothetical protein
VLQGYPETPSARWLTVHDFGCGSDAVMGLRLQQPSICSTAATTATAAAPTAAAATAGATRRSVTGSNKRSSAPSDAAAAAVAATAAAAATEQVGWPAEFVLQCSNGVRVCAHSAANVKPSEARSTVCLTVTYSSGLVVTLRSDGTVKQQYVSGSATQAQPSTSKAPAATVTAAAAASKGVRAVVTSGMVITRSADGCETMLCPDGEVLRRRVTLSSTSTATAATTKPAAASTVTVAATAAATATASSEDWTLTDRAGRQYKRASSSSKWELFNSADAVRAVRDAATGALCWCRADRSATVQYSDGSLLTRHSDGTTQHTTVTSSTATAATAIGTQVLVEAPGYASVEVHVAAQAASAAHAAGNTAAAAASGALSGSSTRLRVALPDGAAATVSYDARVTAAVRGSIGLVCADKTEVVVSDTGNFVVRPRQLWSGAATAKQLAGPTSSMPSNHR